MRKNELPRIKRLLWWWVVLLSLSAPVQAESRSVSINSNKGANYVEPFGELNLRMVWIQGGEFEMGSHLSPEQVSRTYGGQSQAFEGEHPLHRVMLDGFWMGKFEVTNAQFRRFRPHHNSGSHQKFTLNDDNQPVCHVTWEEVTAFCDWLSKGTGRTYRLPSEAQWEYACRGGTDLVRYWGNDDRDIGKYANVLDSAAASVFGDEIRGRAELPKGYDPFINTTDGFQVAAPVGSFKPNAFGLHDMIGNAIEYCRDWHDPQFYRRSPARNPINLTPGDFRVTRGGSWLHPSFRQRAALRGRIEMNHRSARVGFRVCRIEAQDDD